MKKKAIIKKVEEFVHERMAGEGTGHDWWHVQRVRNNAKLINKKEKADGFIIDLAALLHDVGDRKVIGTKEDDYSIAENFLDEQKLDPEVIAEVMFIIKNMSFSKSLGKRKVGASKEFYIVQDADRLDAIGAVGIARAFAYGGKVGLSLYEPDKEFQRAKTTKEYQEAKNSSLHHFEEKLLLLKDLMNTEAAQAIAKKRDKFMRKYLKQFLREWNGRR